MNQEILGRLAAIVGESFVLDSLEDRICFSSDATFREGLPEVVVRPGSREEISAVLGVCAEYGLSLTPRGAGTGLSGGAVTLRGGVCLDLTRLNRIIEIDRENRIAVAEPGVVTADFSAAVSAAGLFYPPDPASSATCTLGGNVAECSGGPRGLKYGVTRDYVTALEIVWPDGSLETLGDPLGGETCGPDLNMLMVGSEGTLGFITKIYFRLIPKPKAVQTMLARFDDLDLAAQAVCGVLKAGIVPTTMEIMDNTTICAVENHLCIGLPTQAQALLLIEVDGDPLGLPAQVERVREVCLSFGSSEITLAKDKAEAERLWLARRSISAACGKFGPTKISEDATVPRARIPEMVRKVREIAQKYKLKMVVFGHAGDGNLHPNIIANKNDGDEMARVELAIEELFDAALSLGGTLSGEHGIGYMKAPFLEKELGAREFAAGLAVKQALDPRGMVNPGKLFGFKS